MVVTKRSFLRCCHKGAFSKRSSQRMFKEAVSERPFQRGRHNIFWVILKRLEKISEAHSEPIQTSKMELFAKIAVESPKLFPQKAPPQMFDKVLSTPKFFSQQIYPMRFWRGMVYKMERQCAVDKNLYWTYMNLHVTSRTGAMCSLGNVLTLVRC